MQSSNTHTYSLPGTQVSCDDFATGMSFFNHVSWCGHDTVVSRQIISEQEGEGHEPILTNRVLEQLIRFYGDAMQSVVGRYIEQSIMTFLEHQERYRQGVRDLTGGSEPMQMMRRAMEQNMEFWNRMARSAIDPENKR